jgi:hypothetical protein
VLFLLVLGQAHTAAAIASETAGETISTSEKIARLETVSS